MSKKISTFFKNVVVSEGVIQSFYQTQGQVSSLEVIFDSVSFVDLKIKQKLISLNNNLEHSTGKGDNAVMNISFSGITIEHSYMLQKSVYSSSTPVISITFKEVDDDLVTPSISFQNISVIYSSMVDNPFLWLAGEVLEMRFSGFLLNELQNDIAFRLIDGTGRAQRVFINDLEFTKSKNVQLVSSNLNVYRSKWQISDIRLDGIENEKIAFIDFSVFLYGDCEFNLTNSSFHDVYLTQASLFDLSFRDNADISAVLTNLSFQDIHLLGKINSVISLVSISCVSHLSKCSFWMLSFWCSGVSFCFSWWVPLSFRRFLPTLVAGTFFQIASPMGKKALVFS